MFGKCLKWIFQVCLRRFPVGKDSLEVKKIIKVRFLWIIASTAGRFYNLVSLFLEKHPRDVFGGTLSLVTVPNWFHNSFLCLYWSKRWQSVSQYNLDKELNRIKDFSESNNFSYTRYNTDTSQKLMQNITTSTKKWSKGFQPKKDL